MNTASLYRHCNHKSTNIQLQTQKESRKILKKRKLALNFTT